MKRTFIAVKIHPEEGILEIMEHLMKALSGEKIKWVNPNNLHITLSFLGDTDEAYIPVISERIVQISGKYPPFELLFRSTGVFRNIRDPRIIWIGTDENRIIKELKAVIEDELEKFGFVKENRDFRPHLTLARVKRIQDSSILEEIIRFYNNREIQRSTITEIIYYESILKPEGPHYIPLVKAPLCKST